MRTAEARGADELMGNTEDMVDVAAKAPVVFTDPRYAPTNLAELFLRESRRRAAISLLVANNAFPTVNTSVLEVGVGRIGWFSDLISWGVPPHRLHGIDLDPGRIEDARFFFPNADLRVGDASDLPWADAEFDLIVASTLFTSLLADELRKAVAGEIMRVMRPGGTILFFDFVVDSPRNPNVRKITRSQLSDLFPGCKLASRSTCLAPPLSRRIAPRSHWLASLLEAIPFLRTHMVAVLTKPKP